LDNWPDRNTRCRFCACEYDRRCALAEGRYGFTRCLWDYELNCCSSPRCVYKAEHGEEALDQRKEPALLTFGSIRLAHGIRSRVASSLMVSKQSVAKVVKGTTKSARISAALAAEIERINSTVLLGNGARAQETRSCETTAQPATATPDTASCGANGEAPKSAPERRAVSPFRSAAEIISILAASSGIYSRVARSVGVSPSVVRRVALGKSVSARISAALIKECAKIDLALAPAIASSPQWQRPCGGIPEEDSSMNILSVSASIGLYSRVARQLGMDRSHVRRVALGQRNSPRISAALAAEIERINQKLLSENSARAQEPSSRDTTAQPATATPDTASCGANAEPTKLAPESRAIPPARRRRNAVPEPLPRTALTASAVARRLQTSPQTIGRLIQDGKLKGYKLRDGGQWHIFISSVESLEAERMRLFNAAEAAS
jgi:hypothetical protein